MSSPSDAPARSDDVPADAGSGADPADWPRLWCLTSATPEGILAQLDELEAHLATLPEGAPADPGFSLPGGGPYRLAMIEPDERKFKLARRFVAKGKPWRGRSDLWFTARGLADQGGKVAFVFPGVEPTFGAGRTNLEALSAAFGIEVPDTDESSLARRSASLVKLGMHLDDVMKLLGLRPDHIAGHSLGEWSGSGAAGLLHSPKPQALLGDLDMDTIDLPDVDFGALGAGADRVMAALEGFEGIELSHDNCPRQSVICGTPERVDAALAKLRDVNIMGYKLDFRSGFHTSVLKPYLARVRGDLDKLPFGPGTIPLWSATTVDRYPQEPEAIKELYLRHLTETVRFRPLIERLYHDEGVRIFVQPGIGSLLGFIDDTLGDHEHLGIEVLNAKRSALGQLHRLVAALWVEGVRFDADALFSRHPAADRRPAGLPSRRPVLRADSAPVGRGTAPGAARRPVTPAPGALDRPAVTARPAASGPTARPAASVRPGASGAQPLPAPDAPPAPPAASLATTPGPLAPQFPTTTTSSAGSGGADRLLPTGRDADAGMNPVAGGADPRASAAPVLSDAGRLALHQAAILISNAARANAEVLQAWSARLGVPGQASSPAPSPTTARSSGQAPRAASPAPSLPAAAAPAGSPLRTAGGDAAAPASAGSAPAIPSAPVTAEAPAVAPAGPVAVTPATGPVKIVRRLSLDNHPETLQHTLFRQRPDWADVYDRFPIMAMTTQLALLADIGREHGGGREVIGLRNVRNFTWLDLSDPVDLEITIAPLGEDMLKINLGKYCRANLVLGEFPSPARYEAAPIHRPRMPHHTGEEMFTERLMFHGPLYQGINRMGPIGEDGIYGEFEALPTPGALLDNVGKLIAYFAMDAHGWGEGPLPLGVERVDFYGPELPDGVPVHCDVRVADLQKDVIKAHATLVGPDGNVWCQLEGWMSHIFHLDERMKPSFDFPDRNFLNELQPEGFSLMPDRWPSGAARDFTARRFLRRRNRDEYEALNLLQKRWWVLEQIAANDGARQWLYEHEGVGLFPPEVDLDADGDKRYRVTVPSLDGRQLYAAVSAVEWLSACLVSTSPSVAIEMRVLVEPEGSAAEAVVIDAAVAEVRRRSPGADVRSRVVDLSGYATVAADHAVVAWTDLA